MKPGPSVEPRRQNTSLYTWSRPGVQASLRQMAVEGTENSWAKLEQAGLVYPYQNRHGLTMFILNEFIILE